ncbi:MAG: D-alanine--D-alanine ligase [Spirochaetes bacterium]|nr:D-alanine--D-alanine ligase [Spirochaetota bacterium]
MKKINMALLFGGKAIEHKTSLKAALFLMAFFDTEKYDIHAVYIDKNGNIASPNYFLETANKFFSENGKNTIFVTGYPAPENYDALLKKYAFFGKNSGDDNSLFFNNFVNKTYDVIFPLFHGQVGEDGLIQGMFDFFSCPYIGDDCGSSVIANDKTLVKQICCHLGILTTEFLSFTKLEWDISKELIIKDIENKFTYPIFVKPPNLGSSIGISKVKNKDDLISGILRVLKYSSKVLIENFIDGKEYGIGVIGHKEIIVSIPCEFPESDNGDFFSYNEKYGANAKDEIIPARLDGATLKKLQDFALQVFRKFNLSGMARIDCFIKNNIIYLNEINTVPGFGGNSVFNRIWSASGYDLKKLIDKLTTAAFEKFTDKNALTYDIEGDSLQI